MGSGGSTLYRLTWKRRVTPSGRLICRLQALERRGEDSGSSSWPTPESHPRHAYPNLTHKDRKDGGQPNLAWVARTAPWPTPQVHDQRGARRPEDLSRRRAELKARGVSAGEANLNEKVLLAPWPTATVNDARSGRNRTAERSDQESGHHDGITLVDAAATIGPTSDGSTASTESAVQYLLNPRFSLWLQGYPAEWASCAGLGTRSCRKSPRSLSPRGSK